ncbi:MAG: hypothetical protein Q8M17_10020 [Actinomycetota bacterium]|nr:hypothetical protein [Actinomycetota bacterium]
MTSPRFASLMIGGLFAAAVVLNAVPAWGIPTQQAGRCTAVPVVGLTVQEARTLLKANGCLPGNAKDGRHFAIKSGCFPIPFGQIAVQSAFGRLGKHELLVLTKSVPNLGSNSCATVNPSLTQHQLSDLNGTYDFGYTVTASTDPAVAVGAQVQGLQLTVQNGVLGGVARGTVTWVVSANADGTTSQGGVARGATGEFNGSQCTGNLTFTIGTDESVRMAGQGISCDGGAITVNVAGAKRP